jgi:hypothetical protein
MSVKRESATKAIRSTRNYRMFHRSTDNRVLDLRKHRKLKDSMEKYGFLQSFPIVCHRNGDKNLYVKDGQHRLTFAEMLGLPVYFVEEAIDFDVAAINCTSKVWNLKDYALKFAANGLQSYQEGIDFAEQYGIPIGSTFAMLGGTMTFSNVADKFAAGEFKVKDRDWAHAVAGTYTPMVDLSPSLKSARFLEACMWVCRVEEFDIKRLVHSASQCRDKLLSYSTRDAYLSMLEEVYNFRRSKLFGLKVAATMAMRDRNAVSVKKAMKAKRQS